MLEVPRSNTPLILPRYSRGEFITYLSAGALSLFSSSFAAKDPTPLPDLHTIRPKILGTTFSQVQCEYLVLDYQKTFQEVCNMGFDVVRLCSYWNRIQPDQKGKYDWGEFDWLLNEAQKYDFGIIRYIDNWYEGSQS